MAAEMFSNTQYSILTNHANLFTSLNVKSQILDNQRKPRPVAGANIDEFDACMPRPL